MASGTSVHLAGAQVTTLLLVGLSIASTAFGRDKPGQQKQSRGQVSTGAKQSDDQSETLCLDCRITAQSVDYLAKKPRHVDAYGKISEKFDMEKIKKGICKQISDDVTRQRCRHFFYSNLRIIEKWNQVAMQTNFHDHVCIKELKLCCPRASFGPRCMKCPKCGPNERCHGEGLRVGNGTCVCKLGHSGSDCSNCLPGYYRNQAQSSADGHKHEHNPRSEDHVNDMYLDRQPDNKTDETICYRCDRSCKQCRHAGPLGCEVCNPGFSWTPDYGCLDIDECVQSNNKICASANTFCVNTIGSYFCYECDRACNGCHGDGPDMCLQCAPGYKMEKENCIATKNLILGEDANYYRYAVYLGLCVSACIILHNNVYLASILGLTVAIYIGGSEYFMKTYGPTADKDVLRSRHPNVGF